MHEVLRDVAVVRALEVIVGIDEVGDRTRGAGHAVDVLIPRTSAQALVAARGEGRRPQWAGARRGIDRRTNLSSRICAIAPTAATSPWLRLAAWVRHATHRWALSQTHKSVDEGHE